MTDFIIKNHLSWQITFNFVMLAGRRPSLVLTLESLLLRFVMPIDLTKLRVRENGRNYCG